MIMTPNRLINELKKRFRISIYDLRKGLKDYETEMYCDSLGITETKLLWAIDNFKTFKDIRGQNKSL